MALGLSSIPKVVQFFVVAGVFAGVGLLIMDNVETSVGENTTAGLAISNGTAGINELTTWFVIIGTIVAAVIIIELLTGAFSGRGRND